MGQTLLFTVRFYEGRYHGTTGYHGANEWPPSPARLFQALMAGVARGSEVEPATQNALDWLEVLPPPVIVAPRGIPGQMYANYVPSNDLDSELGKGGFFNLDSAVASTRVKKSMRPTLFDVESPLLYLWPFDGDCTHASALCMIAKKLYQLGRGIDMAYAEAAIIDEPAVEGLHFGHGGIVYRPTRGGMSGQFLLCPQSGLRKSLTSRFQNMQKFFRAGGTNRKPTQVIVQPPRPRLSKVAYNAQPRSFVFELIVSDKRAAFVSTPLQAAAELVAEVRDKAANCLSAAVPDLATDVERYLVGRGATDVDKTARVHIVPLPSIGHEHADMAIRRIAVYVPQSCPLVEEDIVWAFSQVAWVDSDGVIVKELQKADDTSMADRFERTGQLWQSVTPLALPQARRRRIKQTGQIDEAKGSAERMAEEMQAAVAIRGALRHAGIKASIAEVQAQREPFYRRGVRSELFAAGTRFPKETLWHVKVLFSSPIQGPVLLGDGRYLGLGLMQPADSVPHVIAFAIDKGLANGADPAVVARSARRAMLARFQNHLGLPTEKLPLYVSGHNDDGSPANSGHHRHIAVAADLPRQRILYIAPTLLQRSSVGVDWQSIKHNHNQTVKALRGMDVLRAGTAGRLTLAPALIDTADDPLFAFAHKWESVTEYAVTRHRRRLDGEEALKEDVTAELLRCGWPQALPDSIEILSIRRGARGGLAGRLRLSFLTAQCGPLMIGRTAHKGGGLFAGIANKPDVTGEE